MFTTYPRAEITFDTPDYKKTHAEQRVWSFVEQELLLPWIYLQVTRRSGQEDYVSMLMIYHAHELKEFIDAQSIRMRVEQVHLVTPPQVNGHPTWLMEPLMMAGIVTDPRDGSHFIVYQVEGGMRYSLRDDADVHLEPFEILFSDERDLKNYDPLTRRSVG
ncbi:MULTISPECIES: hypothetical protein [unclassified Pseudomonas]|uniref:hypothetical protein n=1 Tax=Pseudomonas TaxID=286 RepID=UPI000838C751|nr:MULTISPECIES: hypothetical protein [unclassified Pseudomonas]QIH08024.1 hypothetical protein ATY02_15565 [Pseudomonas sp. BIOMIG1BAC]